jgi:subtilisin family serine protease
VKNAGVLIAVLVLVPVFSGCTGGPANEWAYKMVGLRSVGDLNGEGIRVAIVDTGIDADHPSLDHLTIIWRDEVNGKSEPYDDVGHGTHVAGIIAAQGGSFGGRVQGYNLKGAAPKAELIVVKAIRAEDGKGDKADVANGITFAVQNQADVICLSLGANPSALDLLPSDLEDAVRSATNQGILVVASAGNVNEGEQQDDVKVPANLELVIAVGAVDQNKKVTPFSAHGREDLNQGPFATGLGGRQDPNKKPEVVAPGAKIKGAWKDGNYAVASGTSQAAPFVCGALALLLQKCANLRAQNSSSLVGTVKNQLTKTAEKLAGQRTPHDNAAGYGLLRADKLLDAFGSNC